MRADTKTVAIHAPQQKVVAFLANPENLPRWAIGFARGVRRDGERWFVTTQGGGEIGIRIAADKTSGVVDFFMSPAPASRAWPRRGWFPEATASSTSSPSSRLPA